MGRRRHLEARAAGGRGEAGPYLGRAVRPQLIPVGTLPSAFLPRPAASCTPPRPPSPLVAAAVGRAVAHLELVRGRLHQSRHIWSPRGRRSAQGSGGEGARQDRAGRAAPASGVGGGGRLAQTALPAGWRGAQQGSILAAGEPEAQRPPRMRGSGLRGGRGSGLRARRSRPRGGLALVLGPGDGEQKASQERSGAAAGEKWAGRAWQAVVARPWRRAGGRVFASGWRTPLFGITREGQPGGLETERPQGLFLTPMGPGALLSSLQTPTPTPPPPPPPHPSPPPRAIIRLGPVPKALAALPIRS